MSVRFREAVCVVVSGGCEFSVPQFAFARIAYFGKGLIRGSNFNFGIDAVNTVFAMMKINYNVDGVWQFRIYYSVVLE